MAVNIGMSLIFCILLQPVSYTHLDVYKRQQETMANITGQVRQSREEMEAIRNRPPVNESREWLNFRQYKRKPMEFLARVEEYFAKHKICLLYTSNNIYNILF